MTGRQPPLAKWPTMRAEDQIDRLIGSTLRSFATDVLTGEAEWRGREREAISLYAFGYLAHHCEPGTVLYDATQIGIEVAVPQLEGRGKPQVCKDLVVWSSPRQTVWDKRKQPTNRPLAILEWKRRSALGATRDVAWLTEFSKGSRPFVGYSIVFELGGPLTLSRIRGGVVDEVREIKRKRYVD